MKNISLIIVFVAMVGCGTFDKKDKQLIGAGLALSLVDVSSSGYENTILTDAVVIVAASFLSDTGKKRLFKYWIGAKGAIIAKESPK